MKKMIELKLKTTAAAEPREGRGAAADACANNDIANAYVDANAGTDQSGQEEGRSRLARAREQSRPPRRGHGNYKL